MELKLGLLADSANISTGGKLNILGQFTVINVSSGFPMRWPSMVIVLRFDGHITEVGETHDLLIHGVDQDGKQFLSIETKFSFAQPEDAAIPPTFGQIIAIRDIVFEQAGVYAFEVLVNTRYLDSIPLNVIDRRPA